MKLLFFDVETTGLDPKVHGIHQLAGEIVLDGRVIRDFELKINPFKGYQTDVRAMEISKTSSLDLLKYQQEKIAFFNFKCMIEDYIVPHLNDRFFLVGWRNPEFDNRFLQALFERNGCKDLFDSYFWSNSIDVKVLATQYLMDKRPIMESFSLAPVAGYLGIPVDQSKLHKASYDAYLTRKVYEIVK